MKYTFKQAEYQAGSKITLISTKVQAGQQVLLLVSHDFFMFIELLLRDKAKQNITLHVSASHLKQLIEKGLEVHSNKYALANNLLTRYSLVF